MSERITLTSPEDFKQEKLPLGVDVPFKPSYWPMNNFTTQTEYDIRRAWLTREFRPFTDHPEEVAENIERLIDRKLAYIQDVEQVLKRLRLDDEG